MKRLCILVFICALVVAFCSPALAEVKMDFSEYSLDELIEFQEALNTEIDARKKAWAIEHANRSVTFEEPELLLFKGQNTKIVPIVTRMVDDAPEKTTFKWVSSDPGIARCTSGSITAVAAGTATITCTAADDENVFGTVQVTVVLPVTGINIHSEMTNLMLGSAPEAAAADLAVEILPDTAYIQDVEWSSSDESVATVDEHGHVQAVKAGKVVITATSKDTSSARPKTATFRMTVTQAVTGVECAEKEIEIATGKRQTLEASVFPEDASNRQLVWSSSDETIAEISSKGALTPKAPGTCTVTATAADGSGMYATCTVTVIRPVKSVAFAEKGYSVTAGQKKELSVNVEPSDATNKRMTWTSSDDSVATVSASGTITGVKSGKCTIQAVAVDGSEKKASVQVTVYPSLEELLSADQWYYNGGSQTLLNRISFADGTATIEQTEFTGNGASYKGSVKATYVYDDNSITVVPETGNTLRIQYSIKDGRLILGNHTYFTLEEIDKALQGYWRIRDEGFVFGRRYRQEYNYRIQNGTLTYEYASESAVYGTDYFYYGPYSAKYKLGFGRLESNIHNGYSIGFTIYNGKPVLMNFTLIATPSNRLPGMNGYSF